MQIPIIQSNLVGEIIDHTDIDGLAADRSRGGLCGSGSLNRSLCRLICFYLFDLVIAAVFLTGRRPFRAVFLSDQHNRDVLADKRFLDTLEALDPAAVFCGGDMLTAGGRDRGHEENALRLYEALTARWKVFAVDGNHESRLKEHPSDYRIDYDGYRACLLNMGVALVGGRRETARIGGMRMEIAGFEPPLSSYNRLHPVFPGEGEIASALGEKDREIFTVLLSHHPDTFETCRKWGADLILSGHMHGGLIVLPVFGGMAGGSLKPFPKYCRGRFREEDSTMIVSAGIGEHTPLLRVNNPYEIVVLEFMTAKGQEQHGIIA